MSLSWTDLVETLNASVDALLLEFASRDPLRGRVFDQIGVDGAAEEHHVLATWRRLDADDVLRRLVRLTLENAFLVDLLEFAFETRAKARIHGRAAAEDDLLVELASVVHGRAVDHFKDLFGDAADLLAEQRRSKEHFGRFESFAR